VADKNRLSARLADWWKRIGTPPALPLKYYAAVIHSDPPGGHVFDAEDGSYLGEASEKASLVQRSWFSPERKVVVKKSGFEDSSLIPVLCTAPDGLTAG
jgi:hypothetical protein